MSVPAKKVLRVACVGAGSITREFSLRHLHDCDAVQVVAIVDLSIEAAQHLATDVRYRNAGACIQGSKYSETVDRNSISIPLKDLPEVAATTQLADVLPLCDIVYVATPPSSHASITIEALAAKKHVLLEKPLAVSLEDCTVIVNAADEAFKTDQLIVNVNIGMRHNAALHELKRLMQHPSFGELQDISLRLLFMQWPRAWQNQPWVAQRAQVMNCSCVLFMYL
jgi:predicted dehydrogenase